MNSEDQRLIQESVDRFLTDNYSFDQRRVLPESQRAFDEGVWRGLSELGVMALPFPDALGGFGGGISGVRLITGLLGKHLVREPWVHVVVLAGRAIIEVASEAQQARLVPRIASGELRLALAYAESEGRWNPEGIATVAEPLENGYRLTGTKVTVYGAPVAEEILVTARTGGAFGDRHGISLFLVEADAQGLHRRDYYTLDGSAASEITLDGVIVPADALLGEADVALPGIERALDWAIVAQCADAVGAMEAMFNRTIGYARMRHTFGQPLSSQQVIRHRLVDLAVAIEHAAAICEVATLAIEAESPRRDMLVSAAKALVGRESRFVAQWAVQIHGAIGYTDELDIGHYFRRITLFDSQFGNRDAHLRAYITARSAAGAEGRAMFLLNDLSDDERAFQQEVRQFLEDNLTPRMIEARNRTMWAYSDFETAREWQRILAKKGWGAPDWPVEYGGTGWSTTQHLIWALENARARSPLLPLMGHSFCAPCIMAYGTDQQKAEFLPAILNGDDLWAQGYSEPGSGSDLASLQLRATPDGEDYVLNGSKIWTTSAHDANRIFCLVRTSTEERKQQGITFLLVDLDTPGITIRPIMNLAGDHDFNQVFFDDVRVPQSRRLGEEGEGWAVAKHLLKFEHGGNISVIFELEHRLKLLEAVAKSEASGDGGRLAEDPSFQLRLAEVATDAEAVIAAARLTIESIQNGGAPGAMAELRNIRLREVSQRITELLLDAIGPYAGVDQGAARELGAQQPPIGAAHCLAPAALYLSQRAATIAGGTPEIHRNNLARHHLGL